MLRISLAQQLFLDQFNYVELLQSLMELSVAIVLVIGGSFLAVIGLKAVRNYFDVEKIKNEKSVVHQLETAKLHQELDTANNSNRNYVYKIRKMRENYDLDYDDIEVPEGEEDFKLSDLATSIYPKLPASLANLIDKEEFQTAIAKTIEKSPEILDVFVSKFLGKGVGSETNTSPKLVETYL